MDKSLRTWRLTPTKDSELWSQSTYRGEVWVRAHDAVAARKLTAQRFRVRPDRRQARMESPWVVSPAQEGASFSEPTRAAAEKLKVAPEVVPEREHQADSPELETAPHELIAVDIRQAIVALLVAREIDLRGHWLDVYATTA